MSPSKTRSPQSSVVFVDTSAFVALENRRDSRHEQAVREYRRLISGPIRLATSDCVLDETITLLKRRAGHHIALDWGKRLLASSLIELVVVDRAMLEDAMGVFEGIGDQPFSFTDCTSFSLMRSRGIPSAFAFDEDFVRFGFDRLPRP